MYYQLRLHLDVQNVEFSFALFMNGFGEIPSLHFQQVLKDSKIVQSSLCLLLAAISLEVFLKLFRLMHFLYVYLLLPYKFESLHLHPEQYVQ